MVGSGPTGWQDGLRAAELLGTALLVALHGLIVPDLVGEVGVGDGDLGRNMGNDVSIVDYSVAFRQVRCNIGGKVLISHSWFSVGVELVDVAEEGMDVQGSDGGKGRSQAISSYIDLSTAIEGSKLLNFITDVSFHSSKCVVETLMDLTSCAARIGHLY